jgi:hypothetical protein
MTVYDAFLKLLLEARNTSGYLYQEDLRYENKNLSYSISSNLILYPSIVMFKDDAYVGMPIMYYFINNEKTEMSWAVSYLMLFLPDSYVFDYDLKYIIAYYTDRRNKEGNGVLCDIDNYGDKFSSVVADFSRILPDGLDEPGDELLIKYRDNLRANTSDELYELYRNQFKLPVRYRKNMTTSRFEYDDIVPFSKKKKK